MQQWIVLLRGINLGSRNLVSMPELRTALEHAGYEDVRTYLRSGNVVLSASEPEAAIADAVRRIVGERFSVDSPIVTRAPDLWRTMIDSEPFSNHPEQPDDRMKHVIFLAESPASDRLAPLEEAEWGDDAMSISGREVFITYADGMSGSPLQHNKVLKQLDVVGTARNWRTVLAIADWLT